MNEAEGIRRSVWLRKENRNQPPQGFGEAQSEGKRMGNDMKEWEGRGRQGGKKDVCQKERITRVESLRVARKGKDGDGMRGKPHTCSRSQHG